MSSNEAHAVVFVGELSARRPFPCRGSLGIGALALSSLLASCGTDERDPGPGELLVLISVDTLRADAVGAFGGGPSAGTSTMDRWSEAGLSFPQCYSHVPLTLPSHATMLRGRLPPALGVHDNAPFSVLPSEEDLAVRLRDAGFATIAVVSGGPLASGCGLEAGFDRYLEPVPAEPGAAHFGELRADVAVDRLLEELAALPRERRAFLYSRLLACCPMALRSPSS